MKIKFYFMIIGMFVLSSCTSVAHAAEANQLPSQIKLQAHQGILFAGFSVEGHISSMQFDISNLAGDKVTSLQLKPATKTGMFVLPAGEYYLSELQVTGLVGFQSKYKYNQTIFHVYPGTTTYIGHIKLSLYDGNGNLERSSPDEQTSAYLSVRNHYKTDKAAFLAEYHKMPGYPVRKIIVGSFSEEIKRDLIAAKDKAFIKKVRSPQSENALRALDALTTKSLKKISQYANSEWYIVRWGVVLNKNVSMAMLKKLLNDTSDDVKHAAEKQLKAKQGEKIKK